jgi:uncharacterized protein (TIGR02996 family)
MTATTPADLPALVRRQWDRTDDVMHSLVWAEWLEQNGQPDRGELVRLEYECRDPGCDCVACRRVRELRAKLSAWPCPRCESETGSACGVCGNAGRLLPVNDAVITWDCGFPRWVTLPTLVGDAVADIEEVWLPTPRLRALAATPPGGVPLDGVRVGDVEAYWNGAGWCWFDAGRTDPSEFIPTDAEVPSPVFTRLDKWQTARSTGERWKPYHTAEAAQDAFARGLVKFGRGGK